MYGGSGTLPWRRSSSRTGVSPSKRRRKRSSVRPRTAASMAPASRSRTPAGIPGSGEPRFDDARVVENKEISGREQLGQIGEQMVGQRAARREAEQAARGSLGRGVLRDELARQRVVEVVHRE